MNQFKSQLKRLRNGMIGIVTVGLVYDTSQRLYYTMQFKERMDGFYRLSKTEQQQQIFNIHNELHVKYDKVVDREEKKYLIDQVRQKMMKDIDGRVLETHVGSSRNIQYLMNVDQYIGIDYSEYFIDQAIFKIPIHFRPKYMVMDVNFMTFRDNIFDNIIDTFGLEFNLDPVKGLKEMKRVLKKGGRIYFINSGYWNDPSRMIQLKSNYSVFHYGRWVDRNWNDIIQQVGDLSIEYHDVLPKQSIQILILKNDKQTDDS